MSSIELEIDVARVEDAKAILDLVNKCGKQTDFLSFGEEGVGATLEQERLFLKMLASSLNSVMLLAKVSNEVVGMLTVRGMNEKRLCHIGELSVLVDQSFWGYGIASCLMEEMLYWVSEVAGLTRLELTVHEDNERAIALYTKYGFKKEALLERAVCIHGKYACAWQMCLLL